MSQTSGDWDFAEVVRQYADQLFRYSLFLTGDYHQARDLTQEVFCRAFEKRSQLRSPEKVWPWLTRICRRLFLNHLRDQGGEEACPPEVLDRQESDSQPEEPEQVGALRRALAQLPPRWRILLTMFYFDDLSYQEIAEQLRLPMGTVMSGLFRAKRRLRELLEPTQDVVARAREKKRRPSKTKDLARESEKKK